MQTWGDGRFGWSEKDQYGKARSIYESRSYNSPTRDGALGEAAHLMVAEVGNKAKPVYFQDLEGMSEKRFEQYLEQVRAQRGEIKEKVEKRIGADVAEGRTSQSDTAKFMDTDGSVSSLFDYERSPFANTTEHIKTLAGFAENDPHAIAPQPHSKFGLAYSEGSYGDATWNPTVSVPGRVLNAKNARIVREDDLASRVDSKTELNRRPTDSGKPAYVVGLGGLTADMRKEKSENLQVMQPGQDHTVQDGISTSLFRVTKAEILHAPEVVAARALSRAMIDPQGIQKSESDIAGPLRKMKFALTVSAEGNTERERKKVNGGARLPGERGWVGGAKEQRLASDAIFQSSEPSRKVKMTPAEHKADMVAKRDASQSSLNAIADLLHDLGSARDATSRSGGSQTRQYHTSVVRRMASRDDEALPTANIAPGEAKGSQEIRGPGVGGSAEQKTDDGLAKGEWRQLEENVAGESKYGENLDKKQE